MVQSENFFDQKLALATPTRQRVFSTSGGVGSVGDPWEVCNFSFFFDTSLKRRMPTWYGIALKLKRKVAMYFSYSPAAARLAKSVKNSTSAFFHPKK